MTDEEQKTWFEDYLYSTYGANARYYVRIGAKEVCKKILEECTNKWSQIQIENDDIDLMPNDIKNIIKDLGVEV